MKLLVIIKEEDLQMLMISNALKYIFLIFLNKNMRISIVNQLKILFK